MAHAHHHHAGNAHDHAGHAHAHHADGWRFGLSIGLNIGVVALQVAVGLAVGSVALIADAGHNASDVAGLALAAFAAWLARRPGAPRRTYGFAKAGTLAAIANAGLLLFACGAIAFEAFERLLNPAPAPPGLWVMAVAGGALLVNAGSAWALSGGHGHDVNRRAAVLHLAADAATSAAVLAAGAAIALTGAAWIDPAVTLLVVALVLWSSLRLLRESLDQAMDAAPASLDLGAVRAVLLASPGVEAVHDLHVWHTGDRLALTAHLVRPAGSDDAFLDALAADLRARFAIDHATVQVERGAHTCGAGHA